MAISGHFLGLIPYSGGLRFFFLKTSHLSLWPNLTPCKKLKIYNPWFYRKTDWLTHRQIQLHTDVNSLVPNPSTMGDQIAHPECRNSTFLEILKACFFNFETHVVPGAKLHKLVLFSPFVFDLWKCSHKKNVITDAYNYGPGI